MEITKKVIEEKVNDSDIKYKIGEIINDQIPSILTLSLRKILKFYGESILELKARGGTLSYDKTPLPLLDEYGVVFSAGDSSVIEMNYKQKRKTDGTIKNPLNDVKPDFKMNFQTLGIIENILENLGEFESLQKVGKIFEIIKSFSFESKDMTREKQEIILRDIRDKLKEAKTFEIVMNEVREEHDIPTPTMSNIPSVAFKLPAEYSLWHKNALINTNMTTAGLVRTVYLEWLEREAKRQGW